MTSTWIKNPWFFCSVLVLWSCNSSAVFSARLDRNIRFDASLVSVCDTVTCRTAAGVLGVLRVDNERLPCLSLSEARRFGLIFLDRKRVLASVSR